MNQYTDVHQYDQINIICPFGETGEEHIIYNVGKEEYDTCRILQENPRIVAYCNEPARQRWRKRV